MANGRVGGDGGPIYGLAWGFYLVLGIAGVVWIGLRQGTIGLELFLDPASWWIDLGAGLAAGGLLLGAWELFRRFSRRARGLERRIRELLGPVSRSEAVALAVMSGFAEELFFRGAMQPAWGWIAATAIFALLHAGPGPDYRAWTAFALVAGLVLAGLVVWRGRLMAPMAAHILVNAVNLSRLSAPAEDAGEADPEPREPPPPC